MPQKTWDTQSDFNEGTFVNTHSTSDGRVVLDEGQADGTWLSPIYEAVSWQCWAQLLLSGLQPVGTAISYRFRSGETSAECGAADWSEYDDEFDTVNNVMGRSLFTYYLNHPTATIGAFFQIQVVFRAG